ERFDLAAAAIDRDGDLPAGDGRQERDVEVGLDVPSGPGPWASGAPAAHPAEEILEEVAAPGPGFRPERSARLEAGIGREEVGEVERLGPAGAGGAGRPLRGPGSWAGGPHALEGGVAEGVVLLAFLRLAEHVVGLLDLVELLLRGLLVVRVEVGMVLAS